VSKLNYKETKGLVRRRIARSAPTLAKLGLLSGSGGDSNKSQKDPPIV